MRKLIVSNMVSLDGFFAGPNGEIDWFVVDDDFFKYAVDLLNQVDTLIYGRVTYAGMASYWPTAAADDPIAIKMNSLPKVVFSKTLASADWGPATLVKDQLYETVTKLKQQPGKDMVIYGSGTIVAALTRQGLIDEYQLIVCPVALGNGKSHFSGLDHPFKLKLLQTRTFSSGSVLHYYEPDRQ